MQDYGDVPSDEYSCCYYDRIRPQRVHMKNRREGNSIHRSVYKSSQGNGVNSISGGYSNVQPVNNESVSPADKKLRDKVYEELVKEANSHMNDRTDHYNVI